MPPSVDPKQFWDGKILTWEAGRYGVKTKSGSLLEQLADRASAPLRYRLAITKELLTPYVAGKRIVELGCGSGQLAAELIALGASSYHGFDISDQAINNARNMIRDKGLDDKVTFDVCPVEELPALNADIVFSLGLLDWLNETALETVFRVGENADFLHSISEKRVSVSQYIHRLYVYLAYGWRSGKYIPQYHSVSEIAGHVAPHNQRPIHVYRNRHLSFGALVSTLPVDE